MNSVLNLALKKEIFEGLLDKTKNEIPIDKSKWWKKRLTDLDTGKFKDFNVVKASCGSSDKYVFPIEKIEERKNKYIVTVSTEYTKDESDSEQEADSENESNDIPNTLKSIQEELNKRFLQEIGSTDKETENEFDSSEDDKVIETKTLDVKEVYKPNDQNLSWVESVYQLFNNFCSYENVYVVTTPNVQIRSNGNVVGTNRKIFMHSDYDISFPFKDEEYVRYSDVDGFEFYQAFYNKLKDLLASNLIFVKKGSFEHSMRESRDDVFSVKIAIKKKYLFR